jgi:acetyl-CoA carboxylase biotin carboxyl carrier protein
MADVSHQDIEALVRIFDASDWQELRVAIDGADIYLSKNPNDYGRPSAPEICREDDMSEPTASALSVPTDTAMISPEQIAVRAPNLGTFFSAPKPGTPPYVSIGQQVAADTEICLIEVMGLFTPVRAGIAGTISSICVTDKQLVEYDQQLFLIEPLA